MPGALMVSSSFLPGKGGIESYLAQLCAEIAPHLPVLAPRSRDGREAPSDLPYDVVGYPGSLLAPGPRIARAIRSAADERGLDRVLFGTPWPLALLGPGLKRAGLGYSVIIHGAELLIPSVLPAISGRLARALSEAEMLLAVSDYTRSQTVRFLEKKRRRVPPTDLLRARVDLDRFGPVHRDPALKQRLGLAEDQPTVLCLGRLVPRKGVDKLIEVADRIRAEVPRVAIIVAGTGPEKRRLERLAAKTSTPIVFTGRVSDEDAPALYATADVFALPVTDRWFGLDVEGLGVVLLEAAASGTPCVTGRSGGTPEAVVDGETGFVVAADRPEELVDRIVCLLQDNERARGMGSAGRAFVAESYSNRPLPEAFLGWLGIAPSPDAGSKRNDRTGG